MSLIFLRFPIDESHLFSVNKAFKPSFHLALYLFIYLFIFDSCTMFVSRVSVSGVHKLRAPGRHQRLNIDG